jgi:hypothetical protein
VRQRWFGATGIQVPEIAVEGDPAVPIDRALVVNGVADLDRLREAHRQGTPIVVRARDADGVRAALERPEVACVLIPTERRDLLELDLRKLTYG